VKVIAAQPYEVTSPDVASQIAKLKASGADTLAIFATPTFAIQAYQFANKLGWKPKHVINNAVASASTSMQIASSAGQNKLVNGTISIQFLKDPTDPKWKNDPAMKLYRTIMKKYAPSANVADPLHVYGMAAAWTAADALKKAGKDLTRESLRKALDTFTATGNPFMLPGIAVKTAGKDHFPVEQMLLQKWQNNSWNSFGGLWGYRAS
jgi:ABC-type branched-subunit amino acid transport system substrate-binding protein